MGISLPSYGTQIDVYHRDSLNDVLVVSQTGSPTTLQVIVWEDVSTTDQRDLVRLFNYYGFPVTPTPGQQTVLFDTRSFVGSPHPTGLRGNDSYTVTVRVTGPGSPNTSVDTTATITGSSAPTFPQLAAALNSKFTDVDVTWNGNKLVFATSASGAHARVEILPFGTLLNPASPLKGFNGFGTNRVGASTTLEALQLNTNPANVVFSKIVSLVTRKRRPGNNRPAGIVTEYFDSGSASFGSPSVGVWRLLGTNELSGSPLTTPSWVR